MVHSRSVVAALLTVGAASAFAVPLNGAPTGSLSRRDDGMRMRRMEQPQDGGTFY